MRAALLVLGAAACGDSLSLHVTVDHPEGVPVASTIVSVYESGTLHCEQIEYGDLADDELDAALVAEQTIDAQGESSGSLDPLSRTETKLIVARGFDATGTPVTAGCIEKTVIAGDDTVTITTVRTAVASLGVFDQMGPDPLGLTVTLTDTAGNSLPANRVSWRVYAPVGAAASSSPSMLTTGDAEWQLAAPTCTNGNGVARLHPVPPSTISGFAIQVRPSWPVALPPLLTTFTKIETTPYPMAPVNVVPSVKAAHPCAIRVAGSTQRLVCIEDLGASIVARDYQVTVAAGSASLQQVGNDQALDPDAFTVYSVLHGNNRDVYALTKSARVIGLFNPSVPPASNMQYLSTPTATEATLIPACAADHQPRLLIRVEGVPRELRVMDPLGSTPIDYHNVSTDTAQPLSVRATGCLTELDPGGVARIRQAAIVDISMSTTRSVMRAYFECDAAISSKCHVDLPFPGTGAAFTLGSEPRIAGVFLDASGVVISQWVALPDPTNDYRLVERDRVAAASVPSHIVYGQLDGDTLADGFWDIASLDRRSSTLQVSYARMIGTQPLSALSGRQSIAVDDIVVGDVTGDGKDDLVLVGSTTNDVGTRIDGVVVIPAQVAADLPAQNADAACQ
ncbi:MAG: hypothetical protein AB7P03_23625 [Kofleriaceae bacterium]